LYFCWFTTRISVIYPYSGHCFVPRSREMCFVDWRRLGLPGTPSGTPAPTCCGICCRQVPAANPVTFRANGPATDTEPLRSPANPASCADSPKKRGTEEHPWGRTTQTCVIHFTHRLPDNSPSLGVETQSCPTDTPLLARVHHAVHRFPRFGAPVRATPSQSELGALKSRAASDHGLELIRKSQIDPQ
jgi:hypothetical protein